MEYRHYVYLTYETAEQLNRHAARLIDREGFHSGGVQPDATYLFTKCIDKEKFQQLMSYGREQMNIKGNNPLRIAVEKRTAW